jgi:hypothetical protein
MGARIKRRIRTHIPSAFQGRLDFSASARALSLSSEHPAERAILRGLFFVLALLACAYLYFVGASILHIIARKESAAESARLASSVGALEEEYFALSEGVTLESMTRVGLSPVSDTVYLYRPGAVGQADGEPHEI